MILFFLIEHKYIIKCYLISNSMKKYEGITHGVVSKVLACGLLQIEF